MPEDEVKTLGEFGITVTAADIATTDAATPQPEANTVQPVATNNTNAEAAAATEPTIVDDKTATTDPKPETPLTPATTEEFKAEDKFDKKNHAFAEMRNQNKGYAEFIMSLAKAANIEAKNADEAKEALQQNLKQVDAKTKNVPPEILAALEEKDNTLKALQAENRKNTAIRGFEQVRALHKLDSKQLTEFADKLIEANKNPFEQDIDLVKEYRLTNFEQIMKAAREEGRLEEVKRRETAANTSTQPNQQRGKTDDTGVTKNINTIAELEAFMKANKF